MPNVAWVRVVVGVLLLAGCRLGFQDSALDAMPPDVAPGYFTVGGTLTGLTGSIVLVDNGVDPLTRTSDGPFVFGTPIMDGGTYSVTIATQPANAACSIAKASGTVSGAAIVDIAITCYAGGSCPSAPLTFTADAVFTLPAGCAAFTVEAYGGGGAASARNIGSAAAAGGAGGYAKQTFTAETPGTSYAIAIGGGGTCGSTMATPGGYSGGGGGVSGGNGTGGTGAGAAAPPGGLGGAGSTGTQPGGAGGNGGYGGGGGGGGGDQKLGNSGGGATTFRLGATDYVVAGGGGGAGTSDQNGDIGGEGGAACTGYDGANGQAAVAGSRSGGGGGGGACACTGTCDAAPTSTGGAGGLAGTSGGCAPAQNGAPGQLVISF